MVHLLRAMHAEQETSVRARYAAGTQDGEPVPGYADEDGVDPSWQTETYAEVTLRVRNSRWAGVPFAMRSGKALAQDRREVVRGVLDRDLLLSVRRSTNTQQAQRVPFVAEPSASCRSNAAMISPRWLKACGKLPSISPSPSSSSA